METLTLTELAGRARRRWRHLVVGAALGLVLGAAVAIVTPTHYTATTVLFVDSAEPDRIDMAAEVAVATSRRVTSEAVDAWGAPGLTVVALEDATAATAVTDSRLLRITYRAADPRAATKGADAVAQAYLAVRSVDAAARPGQPAVDGSVVDPARTPTAPAGPGGLTTMLGTTVLGLLLATAAVVVRPTRSAAARAS